MAVPGRGGDLNSAQKGLGGLQLRKDHRLPARTQKAPVGQTPDLSQRLGLQKGSPGGNGKCCANRPDYRIRVLQPQQDQTGPDAEDHRHDKMRPPVDRLVRAKLGNRPFAWVQR
jgi:hypothetical protein